MNARVNRFGATALAATGATVFAHPVLAHHVMDGALPQTLVQGFLSGLAHPIIGLDHAAFIVAAGFLLAALKGGLWGIVALIAGTLLGATLHLTGVDVRGGEIGVAFSVMLVGALVMTRRPFALPWLLGGLAFAGVLHGHAYAESIFGAEAAPLGAYLAGFSLIQFCIASVVALIHRRLIATRAAWLAPVASGLGGSVSAVGLAFLVLSISG
ncbi:MAG: HupE/UreJ family protein [Proteobacteria bacterium]|nr:HupE/UreJ family protein [Pseudomonadota bacterium]